MKYSQLAKSLLTLESRWHGKSGAPPEHLKQFIQQSNSSWDFIYFPLDSLTKSDDPDLPIVVCIGANYADGPNKLPSCAAAPAVCIESEHGGCRGRIKKHLADIERKAPWKGKLCLGGAPEYIRSFEKFHLVMMNLSPWITQKPWSKLRDERGGAFLELLARPPHGDFNLEEFKAIKKALKSANVLWYGHGNSEIYGLFLHICYSLDFVDWVFDSNLSQRSLYSENLPSSGSPQRVSLRD